MGACLMVLMLGGCQTLSGVKLPKALNRPCPVVNFSAGRLLPQVIGLKTQYELCRINNNGLIELLSG